MVRFGKLPFERLLVAFKNAHGSFSTVHRSPVLPCYSNGCVSKDVEVNIILFIKKAFQNLKQSQLREYNIIYQEERACARRI